MTNEELIKLLNTMPPDAEIVTEGCDCYGDCKSVELTEWSDTDKEPRRLPPNPTGAIWEYPKKLVILLKREE